MLFKDLIQENRCVDECGRIDCQSIGNIKKQWKVFTAFCGEYMLKSVSNYIIKKQMTVWLSEMGEWVAV